MNWNFWKPRPAATQPEPPKRIDSPRLRVSDAVVDFAATKPAASTQAPRSAFSIPKPPPGVLPGGKQGMAEDSNIVEVARWAEQSGFGDGMFWLGYTILAELSQRPEYRRISEVKAKEMTRKWVKLKAAGDESRSNEIRRLTAAMRRFKVQDAYRRCAELDGFFGRSHLYFDTGHTDNRDELKTVLALSPDKIAVGGLKGLRVVEPIWTYPGQYNSTDPLRPDFYRPQTWYVMGKEIHASRLLTFIGHEMPDILKPAYMFGGVSLTQLAKPYVDLWLHDRTAVSEAIEFFSTSVLKTNMATMMAEGDGNSLIRRLKAFVGLRKNRGVLAIDKETEEFTNVSMPLGTLDKLVAIAQEHICSAIGMPLVKFTGITPSGLNASSDGEIRVWYDDVNADQEDMFTDNLARTLKVLQLNEFGKIDEDITHEFVALYQLDEAGKAAVQKTKADTAAVYAQEGVVTAEEIRESLSSDTDSLFGSVDLSSPAPGKPEGGEADLNDQSTDHIDEEAVSGGMSGANAGF